MILYIGVYNPMRTFIVNRDEKLKLALYINKKTERTRYITEKDLYDSSMEIISDTKMESSEGRMIQLHIW